MYTICKKKKKKETGLFYCICGQVIRLMFASGKFICVLSLYIWQADRQGGKQQTMATNHGYSLMIGCNVLQTQNCHLNL